MVVGRGYFRTPAHTAKINVASARRVAKNSHLYGNSSYTSLIIIISSVGQTTANSAVSEPSDWSQSKRAYT